MTEQLRVGRREVAISHPDRWTIKTIAKRLDAEGRPWRGMARRARALPGA